MSPLILFALSFRGKLDSLVFDGETNRLCVVEYKTYAPTDPTAQLAQVALYSYMLSAKY